MERNCPFNRVKSGIDRIDVINYLINKFNYKSYLEIGVQSGYNFYSVRCDNKVGVDPFPCPCPKCKIKWNNGKKNGQFKEVTSDDFFKTNQKKFDIVFIDGLHKSEQVYKDFENAVTSLNEGGVILLHDMLPIKEEHQISYPSNFMPLVFSKDNGQWNGDCWKAFVRLQEKYISWDFNCIDMDEGIGIVKKLKHPLDQTLIKADLTWKNFIKYKENWMKPISYKNFKEKYDK